MDKRKLLGSVQREYSRAGCTPGYVRRRMVVFGVQWRRMTSNGVDGWLASNGVEWHMRALTRKASLVSVVVASSMVSEWESVEQKRGWTVSGTCLATLAQQSQPQRIVVDVLRGS